ncbi:uncharacterized protein [Halyomorpha halys]|uniref:uncharacterized protein n=1 Tax=Halyomorpha halys TaxID=286706 RepID=UPI0006D5201D|nr:uncharacterized protein LOC106677044 [Halyomorpha halys]
MNQTEEHITNSTLIKNIYDFMQNGEIQIKYRPNEDIVLLLGNTGSGKSTLTQYISGNAHTLISQEVQEGIAEFVIVDTQNKVSSDSTLVSQTVYPDLVEDAEAKTLYYDCPGFSDTRSAAHEIAATYFIKKVIDSARSVKLVFVVSYSSVSRGADRQDLILMLQQATDFMKQIEKYKNSIALVVTKVENRYIDDNLVPDEKVVKAIGYYLEQAKRDIDQQPEMVSPDSKEKVLSLLDVFLSKGEYEQYIRIGIFRKPNKAGLLSDIELMKEGIIPLQNLINKSIQYVEASDKDFGYTVSAKSKIHINGLVEEINKTIVKEIVNMGKEVEKFCIGQEEIVSDLEYLISLFQKLSESFSKIQGDAATPENFISEIDINNKHFKIGISDHQIKTVEVEGDYINFLNLVSNQSVKSHKLSLLATDISKLTEYLSDSHTFYSFMNSLYTRLSTYDIQKNRNNFSTIYVNSLEDFYESPLFNEITDLFKQHNGITKTKLDKPKLKFLNRVLGQTLRYQIEQVSPQSDKIVVKGVNVNLSDLSELLRNKDIKFIEVYALHKVFIDTSLDLTGREIQMVILAPVWEVIGSQSIILDGKPGSDHNSQKVEDGIGYGQNGLDGIPGEPGGPAGNFIGIGKQYFNEENLHISANGGKGGRGQDGGDGTKGCNGKNCPTPCSTNKSSIITIVYNSIKYKYEGGRGGNGGDGGIGGYGGQKGSISIIKVGTESGVVYPKQNAQDGPPGADGTGGSGGKGGQSTMLERSNFFGILGIKKSFKRLNEWNANGVSGRTGNNQYGRKNAEQLKKLINLNNTKTEYKDYLLNNIKNNNLQETFLMMFLSEIDNNPIFITQPTNRKRRSIMNFTAITNSEEQPRKTNKYKPNLIRNEVQRNNPFVGEGKDNYYLDHYLHLDKITEVSRPVSNGSFFETESAKQTPLKPIFPISMQLENMKTEKDINIIDQYSSTNLHGNFLLAEMALKKLMKKEISPSHSHKGRPKEGASSAHDLAYSHYLAN